MLGEASSRRFGQEVIVQTGKFAVGTIGIGPSRSILLRASYRLRWGRRPDQALETPRRGNEQRHVAKGKRATVSGGLKIEVENGERKLHTKFAQKGNIASNFLPDLEIKRADFSCLLKSVDPGLTCRASPILTRCLQGKIRNANLQWTLRRSSASWAANTSPQPTLTCPSKLAVRSLPFRPSSLELGSYGPLVAYGAVSRVRVGH